MPAGVRAALLRLKELAGLGGCCPSGAVRACCCRLCTSSAKVEAAPGSGEYAGAPPLPSNEDGSMLPMPSMSSSLLVICGERTWCALGLGLGLGLGVRAVASCTHAAASNTWGWGLPHMDMGTQTLAPSAAGGRAHHAAARGQEGALLRPQHTAVAPRRAGHARGHRRRARVVAPRHAVAPHRDRYAAVPHAIIPPPTPSHPIPPWPLTTIPAADAGVPAPHAVCSQHTGYVSESSQMRDDLLLRCHVAPFAKPISEREWLRGATRMWELVRKSSNLADYNRTLQKLHYYQ